MSKKNIINERNFITTSSNSENDVIKFYEEYANNWDNRFGDFKSTNHFLEKRFSIFEKFIKINKKNSKSALELGVGTGVYVNKLTKLFNKITAVDGSNQMISILKKKVSKNKIKNVDCLCLNVLDMKELKDQSFDCIYFFGLIEHIVDTSK